MEISTGPNVYQCVSSDEATYKAEEPSSSINSRMLKLSLEVIKKIAKNTQALEDEKARLLTENKIIEEQLVQLKLINVTEWNSMIALYRTHMGAICDKMKAVKERCVRIQGMMADDQWRKTQQQLQAVHGFEEGSEKTAKLCGANHAWNEWGPSVDSWISMTSEYRDEAVLNYQEPKEKSLDERESISSTISTLALASNELIQYQSDPVILGFIQENMCEYQAVETETSRIRAINQALLDRKEGYQGNLRVLAMMLVICRYTHLIGEAQRTANIDKDSIQQLRLIPDVPRNPSYKKWFERLKIKGLEEQYVEIVEIFESTVSQLEAFKSSLAKMGGFQ